MTSIKQPLRKSALAEVATTGLDLAKYSVQFVGLNAAGRVLTRRQYSKGKLLEVTAKMRPCRIGMETSSWPRGHDVKLMPPKYVKASVKREKTDARDAEACAEACLRTTMRFVPLKSENGRSFRFVPWVRTR